MGWGWKGHSSSFLEGGFGKAKALFMCRFRRVFVLELFKPVAPQL